MRISTQGRAAMVAAVMTLQFSGCADSGPTAVVTPTSSRAVMALDLDAGRFSLDIGRQELWHPDGRVVDLTVDETELLATEFAAQASLAALASFTASAYPDPNDQCDWHTETCEDAMLRATRSAGLTAVPGPFGQRELQDAEAGPNASNQGKRRDFERTYGRIKVRISNDRPGTSLRSADPVVEFQQGWTCADLWSAMQAAREEAATRRVTVGSVLSTVFGWVGFTLTGGVLRGTFGASERGAVTDVVGAMETNRVNLALRMLDGLYKGMGCSSASGGSSPSEVLPPGWEMDCTDVWGTIILPGNQVYSGWYKECVIVRAS